MEKKNYLNAKIANAELIAYVVFDLRVFIVTCHFLPFEIGVCLFCVDAGGEPFCYRCKHNTDAGVRPLE